MSYLDNYLLYSSENEASPKYHKWAALVTLSMAITRRVWTEQGDWKVNPNLYIGFVGDPASGKSVAMGFAERLVQDFIDYETCPAAITREAFTKFLAEKCRKQYVHDGQEYSYSPLAIFSNELVTFLGSEPIKMVDLLTDIYDRDEFRVETKNQGKDFIPQPCVTLLGCITPTTLNAMLTQKLVTGGFTRRMIPVFSRHRGAPIPRPRRLPVHIEAKNKCIIYAKSLAKLSGPFTWAEDAGEWFDAWYIDEKTPQMNSETNEVMRRYFTAKDVLLLKVAMLLALANEPKLELTQSCLIEANEWLTEIEPDILTIFGGGGRNELTPVTHALDRFIHEAGANGVNIRVIKKMYHHMARDAEILEVLNHMVETGTITRRSVQVQTDSGSVQADLYRHRDHLPKLPHSP